MKKLINRPEDVVEQMVEGLASAWPGLRRVPGFTVLTRSDLPQDPAERPVVVISGGGSGHEPAHAGYVGRGMLAAAVAGDVFTSPSPDAVLAAIQAVAGPAGVLLIVKNYTGDRLNFGLAAELARAQGIAVETVIVADDVALAGSVEHAGRRGIAGTILVHKVAGAAAEAGLTLAEVAVEAQAAADAVRTMGVALSACTVPAAGHPGFTLGEDEIELGLGIHGEPGIRRGRMESADALVDTILKPIVEDLQLTQGEQVVLLVNNLGATPAMELAIVARRAIEDLEARGLIVEHVLLGTFLTALEMAGVSLSVMRVDDRRLALLETPTAAHAWPNAASERRSVAPEPGPIVSQGLLGEPAPAAGPPQTPLGRRLQAAVAAVCRELKQSSGRLNDLDQVVGDGDMGISLARGADAIEAALATIPFDAPPDALHTLSLILQRRLGGTSGPLYAALLLRAAHRLRASGTRLDDPGAWASAFQAGCQAVTQLGGAAPGDRTMLDALEPAATAFEAEIADGQPVEVALAKAAAAAQIAAAGTARLIPKKGRSSYLGERALGHPDPGATAVGLWLDAIARSAGASLP